MLAQARAVILGFHASPAGPRERKAKMIPALPLVGKILVDLAASGASAPVAPQESDPQKVGGAANSGDFTQTVDDLAQAAGAATPPHGAHGAARS